MSGKVYDDIMTDTRADRPAGILPESRERNAIRAAIRQRAVLRKSRLRDPRAYGYGRYWLILHDGRVIGTDENCHPVLTLADVEVLLDRGLSAGETAAA